MSFNGYYDFESRVGETMPDTTPEVLRNPIYTPGFLKSQIGKLMRVEFLIGTNSLVDRTGVLEDVGASYIILRSIEGNTRLFCDLYAIKFITITDTPFIYNPTV